MNPYVFMNACHSGRLRKDSMMSQDYRTGFATFFLERGARGVIGTLGKVIDQYAVKVSHIFFAECQRSPLGKCTQYAQLAQKIDQHLVLMKPMSRQEIEEAITKPAELVDLQVEKALVTKMTEDVVESPGSLLLLQYTLTELWKDAQTGANRNRLTLESYEQLGGIEKTLSKRANQVYASLKDEEKPVAKRIFLELTQLGETSDTRRRVYKEDLVNSQHSEELLDRTIEQLVRPRLIITTNESRSQNGKPGVILDIVHEALIRHWQELRQWVAENQVALEIERKIEARAKDWERNGKTEDLGLLLQGATLIEAETYLKDYDNLGLLDGIAQEYIEVSQTVRDRRILLEELERERKQREMRNPLSRFLGFFRKQ